MSEIIYLNGPSSCGKTTIAKALQEALEEPFLHLGIDKIIGFMPDKINDWEGKEAKLGFSWKLEKDPSGHPTYHIHSGPFAKKIVRALKDISQLLASQNFNLIIDDVAFGSLEIEEWKKVLKNFNVLYVGVITPLEILEKREKERKDRQPGSARGQYFKVHENVQYDLEVNTYNSSLKENVEKIIYALKNKSF